MTYIANFIKDLQLPQDVLDSLPKERTNEELRVYAQTLPQLEYPDTYKLAGKLFIYLNIKSSPKSMLDYVSILENILKKYCPSLRILESIYCCFLLSITL